MRANAQDSLWGKASLGPALGGKKRRRGRMPRPVRSPANAGLLHPGHASTRAPRPPSAAAPPADRPPSWQGYLLQRRQLRGPNGLVAVPAGVIVPRWVRFLFGVDPMTLRDCGEQSRRFDRYGYCAARRDEESRVDCRQRALELRSGSTFVSAQSSASFSQNLDPTIVWRESPDPQPYEMIVHASLQRMQWDPHPHGLRFVQMHRRRLGRPVRSADDDRPKTSARRASGLAGHDQRGNHQAQAAEALGYAAMLWLIRSRLPFRSTPR